MNNIPPLDLTRQYQQIDSEVSTQVLEILRSGRYIGGATVSDFEQAFAQYTGTQYAVGCNSGTDALYLALRVLNIGAGDEVITSPFTFIATAEVISLVGAKPVFVDIDPESYNLDVSQVEAAITERTKAIIPVHLFGRPVVMDALMAIAQRHNLLVIEDCAQATGAEWQGQKVGSIGHLGCFSFFPTKNLGACGDGGAITTNDPNLAAQLRMLREHGSKERYIHELIGVNSRLDALQAAILTIKLSHLDQWNEGRSRVAERYHQLLSPLDTLALPSNPDQGKAVWNQYSIRILTGERDNIRAKLAEQGISSMIYYPIPLHQQPVYQHLNYPPDSFPHSEQVARQILALPMFPELSPSEQERVANTLQSLVRSCASAPS
ncbi:DegT/DnrJ/EryC1/StrS family aminotransferase [Spirulina subsalsa]|uniref:DegT/DnrJ/EryC1/StrS family aminotransferase n=1 Tax=Spirulina subsalsa TaxID=54311 RepID=UPI0002D8BC71|nr:DegT/DnrJ/EryC1/StrS family aminotransferase [Spirulina subsalsa]